MSYLKEIVFCALICGFITKLSVKRENGSGKYVSYVATLVFILVIISPLIGNKEAISDILDSISEIGNIENGTEGEYEGDPIEIISREICKAAANKAADRFSVPSDSFSFKMGLAVSDDGDVSIKSITVYFSGEGISETELEYYFFSLFSCPVEVVKDG